MKAGLVAAALTLSVVGAACSGQEPPTVAATPGPAVVGVPSQIIGLDVVAEDVSAELEGVEDVYFDSVGLFSFREDELLRATLQVSRFNERAEPEDDTFRGSILNQLGSSVPVDLRVGDETVWRTTGNDQSIYVWFEDRSFLVLSVRDDYPFPRTLLRRLVEAGLTG